MTAERTYLLRILANLDQSMARVESILEHAQTYAGWQVAVDARAKLLDAQIQALEALKRTA